MIEETIAASLEPIVEIMVKLEKQVHAIDKVIGQEKPKDGAPGKDAEPVDTEKLKHDVIADLAISDVVKTEIDKVIGQVKPKDGAPGKDAEPVDTEKLKHDVIADLAISDVVKTAIDQKTEKEIDEINQVFNES